MKRDRWGRKATKNGKSHRLGMPQCACGVYLSKRAKRIGEKLCDRCSRKVTKQGEELARATGRLA